MDYSSINTANLNQTDEEILVTTISDEELEFAAGTDKGAQAYTVGPQCSLLISC